MELNEIENDFVARQFDHDFRRMSLPLLVNDTLTSKSCANFDWLSGQASGQQNRSFIQFVIHPISHSSSFSLSFFFFALFAHFDGFTCWAAAMSRTWEPLRVQSPEIDTRGLVHSRNSSLGTPEEQNFCLCCPSFVPSLSTFISPFFSSSSFSITNWPISSKAYVWNSIRLSICSIKVNVTAEIVLEAFVKTEIKIFPDYSFGINRIERSSIKSLQLSCWNCTNSIFHRLHIFEKNSRQVALNHWRIRRN